MRKKREQSLSWLERLAESNKRASQIVSKKGKERSKSVLFCVKGESAEREKKGSKGLFSFSFFEK